MNEILLLLDAGSSVIIQTDKLPEFWEFCKSSHNLYSFRYSYFEDKVEINITKDTILRVKPKTKTDDKP